jgi:glucose-1-phosphate thymidylyltransferase
MHVGKLPPIGVIPAAGLGTRLASLGYPKELLPIVYRSTEAGVMPQPIVIASLEQMQRAGIADCVVVIAESKLEIARVLGERASGVSLAYVVRSVPRGLADALDATQAWTRERDVCLALPDTLITPDDAMARIVAELHASGADLVLGVFPTEHPEQLGPVRFADDGRVLEVLDKPAHTDVRNTWGMAAWSPRFTALLHEAVTATQTVVLGDVFDRAVKTGLAVRAVVFTDGRFIDAGTPAGLATALSVQR